MKDVLAFLGALASAFLVLMAFSLISTIFPILLHPLSYVLTGAIMIALALMSYRAVKRGERKWPTLTIVALLIVACVVSTEFLYRTQ